MNIYYYTVQYKYLDQIFEGAGENNKKIKLNKKEEKRRKKL